MVAGETLELSAKQLAKMATSILRADFSPRRKIPNSEPKSQPKMSERKIGNQSKTHQNGITKIARLNHYGHRGEAQKKN